MIFSLLDDRAGPPVRDDQRQRIFVLRTNVNEMNVLPVDLGQELRYRVELRLALAPVVIGRPVASPAPESSPTARLAYRPLTNSRVGHRVALMRRRKSSSSASGTFR